MKVETEKKEETTEKEGNNEAVKEKVEAEDSKEGEVKMEVDNFENAEKPRENEEKENEKDVNGPKTPKKEEAEINVKEEIKKDLKFTPNKDEKKDDDVEYEEVEEFYVKYKNL